MADDNQPRVIGMERKWGVTELHFHGITMRFYLRIYYVGMRRWSWWLGGVKGVWRLVVVMAWARLHLQWSLTCVNP